MRISFAGRSGMLDEQILQFGERRLLFALSRFGARVESVKVEMEDLNSGGRRGIDKCCRITVRLRQIPNITVTAEHETTRAALAAGAERVGQAVARAIDRYRANWCARSVSV